MWKSFWGALYLALLIGSPAIAGEYGFVQWCQDLYIGLQNAEYSHFQSALLRGDIFYSVKERKTIAVKISNLLPIHPINYDFTVHDVQKRVAALRANRDALFSNGHVLSREQISKVMPSQSGGSIRVVKDAKGRFVVFDGNGRVESLREAFGDMPDLAVEVEFFDTDNRAVGSFVSRLRRIRGFFD